MENGSWEFGKKDALWNCFANALSPWIEGVSEAWPKVEQPKLSRFQKTFVPWRRRSLRALPSSRPNRGHRYLQPPDAIRVGVNVLNLKRRTAVISFTIASHLKIRFSSAIKLDKADVGPKPDQMASLPWPHKPRQVLQPFWFKSFLISLEGENV